MSETIYSAHGWAMKMCVEFSEEVLSLQARFLEPGGISRADYLESMKRLYDTRLRESQEHESDTQINYSRELDNVKHEFASFFVKLKEEIRVQNDELIRERKARITVKGGLKELVAMINALQEKGWIEHVTDKDIALHFYTKDGEINSDSLRQRRAQEGDYIRGISGKMVGPS